MAGKLTPKASITSSVCTFTLDGIAYSPYSATSFNLSYDFDAVSPSVSINWLSIKTDSNPGTGVTLTAELIVAGSSSGQIALTRLTNTRFELWLNSTPNSVAVPVTDNDVTVQIIVSANGTVMTTNSIVIPPPFRLTVTSISPSPATGKVCTVTFNRTIPDGVWKLSGGVSIATYANDFVYQLSVRGYKTDMSTRIESLDYGFNQCTFYSPYDSGKQRTSDQARIKLLFNCDLAARYSDFIPYDLIQYDMTHIFTMSYVNQTDPLTAPTVTLNAIAENPSGMLNKYGKYVGGGIGKLTFSLASVTYKFGATFSQRTMALYNSNGTLNNRWTYSNTNSFTLSLTNKTDSAWYMVVSITDSAGRVGSATTAVFQAYGYDTPAIISFAASRCDQDGTPNDSGAYCKITYQFKIYALGNHNAKTVTLNAPDDTHIYTTLDYDHGSAYQYISEADTETSYQIDLILEDDFRTVTQTMNLSTAGVIMDFLYNGKGIGLGKVAETSNMVEVNPQWTFKAQNITIRGQDLATILQSLGYTFPT